MKIDTLYVEVRDMKRVSISLIGVMMLCGMLVAMIPLGTSIDGMSIGNDGSRVLDTDLNVPVSSIEYSEISQGISQKPAHYAVIVGISDYKAIGDLNFCDEDANDWYNYLTQIGYDDIVVLGDNTSSYIKYDGLASEHNAKLALTDLVGKAGPKDTIAFISSGHGSGDSRGSSLLCMWDITAGEDEEDGFFWDVEVADILEHAVADQIFVFLDHCFAGGFGEELMSMPNSEHVYFASTCDIMGMGWDAGEYENGLWTYFFLEYTLIQMFDSDPRTELEVAFDIAAAAYPYPRGAHHPQEYDGDPVGPFLLW
ncbi:MAG: caspase family protein [Candidatus Thorarchaeota archaeon]